MTIKNIKKYIYLISISIIFIGCTSNKSNNTFTKLPDIYKHQWSDTAFPFTGACVVDIDNDDLKEIFVGGGQGQEDALLSFKSNQLINKISNSGLSSKQATYGCLAIDFDNDKDTDLIINRNDGVFVYFNNNSHFTPKKLPIDMPKNSVSLSTSASDIDLDGDFDLYINMFVDFANFRSGVFNDPSHARKNILLRNDGNFKFTDITSKSNTAGKQNTFLSVFTDLNNDGRQDLVVAQNTGQVEIFKNNHDNTFSSINIDSGYGFWMGIGLGDIDKDGDQDIFLSNAGSSIPAFLTKGDIKDNQRQNVDWLLLKNNGNFNFTDNTKSLGITDQGFAWGAVFEDLDINTNLDLLVAENYIKWPIHKLFKLSGKVYSISDSGNFSLNKDWGISNKYFGQSPLIVDINNDFIPDIAWLNIDGPFRVFINKHKGDFLSISLPSNALSAGAKVIIELTNGKKYTKEWLIGTGMLTQQDTDLFFGLAPSSKVKNLKVKWANNQETIIPSPTINKRYLISKKEYKILSPKKD